MSCVGGWLFVLLSHAASAEQFQSAVSAEPLQERPPQHRAELGCACGRDRDDGGDKGAHTQAQWQRRGG